MQVQVSQIAILSLFYKLWRFFWGPTAEFQCFPYAGNCDLHIELVQHKEHHLVLTWSRLFFFRKYPHRLSNIGGVRPEPVLVLDNAPFHHTKRIEQMCHDASVKLMWSWCICCHTHPILIQLKRSLLSWKLLSNGTGTFHEEIRSKALILFWNGALTWLVERRTIRGHFRLQDCSRLNPLFGLIVVSPFNPLDLLSLVY